VVDSFFRSARLSGPRRRVALIADTFFLHVHPARVHPHSLKPTYTLGLGVISFFLFLIVSATGILLLFYYIPTTQEAYASMQDLIHVVTFGRIVRNLHRWTAEAMVVAVVLHLLRVFYTGAYKPPREFNWVVGVALLVLTLGLSFTGYLLPWDQLAFWAITVGTNIAAYFPLVGGWLRFLLLGGETVGEAALLRFYVLHAIVLPALLTVLVGYHFWRIRKDRGLARPDDLPPQESVWSFPRLVYVELAVLLALLVVFLPVAYFFDAPLGPPADPQHPPNPAKAPWYFVGFQELVSYSALWGGGIAPLASLLLLLLLPYLDRDRRGVGRWFARERRGMVLVWTAAVALAVGLTVVGAWFRGPNWGFYFPWEGWPGPR
jgi:quinol-cytochrome oxidoreductase complex cytochrome b subunit